MYVKGYNTNKNNLKCKVIEQDIFNYLGQDYDKYADVIQNEDLPLLRRKLIKLDNSYNISNKTKDNIKEMLSFIIKVQNQKKGIYWY
jgi:hypothetical protein